jgi:16S rRNA (cytosine1402-N4)-methyltransferase
MQGAHTPVMVREVLQMLQPSGGGWVVDGSVGLGGHALAILSTPGFTGGLLGIDRDAQALQIARQTLESFQDRVRLHHAEFAELGAVLDREGLERIDGLILDLGTSAVQLQSPERGFSFLRDGPLDMRMDPSRGTPLAQLLGRLGPRDLEQTLREYGEERHARRVARAIHDAYRARELQTTGQLADLIVNVLRRRPVPGRLHPAARCFQALRMLVNQEIEQLKDVLSVAPSVMKPGARIVVLSYHSGEDRVTKHTLREQASRGVWELLTRKPLRPSPEEVRANPRARSSRLRAALRRAD